MQKLQQVELVCQTGSSNKFYEITFYLVGTKLIFGTQYGPIGKSGNHGAYGKLQIPDVCLAIANRTLENDVAAIVKEANKVKDSKLKKGYQVASGEIDAIELIVAIYKLYPSTKPVQSPSQNPPSDTAFEVEITSILAQQIKVAKVLPDFSYDVIGQAINSKKLSLKTGDMVIIDKAKQGHWEILSVA